MTDLLITIDLLIMIDFELKVAVIWPKLLNRRREKILETFSLSVGSL